MPFSEGLVHRPQVGFLRPGTMFFSCHLKIRLRLRWLSALAELSDFSGVPVSDRLGH